MRIAGALFWLLLMVAAIRPAAAQERRPIAPDYANPAAWACRPGAEGPCITGLDVVAVDSAGHRTPRPFTPAADPPIDCFYVYPTVSREKQGFADLSPDAAVMGVVRAQAGRLAERCRLFVPLYRQATLQHLDTASADRWDGPYQDIAAAWAWYLAHDNQGRGVVLIGHSQGTLLLQRLMAAQIDGKPAQSHLVAAFLIGNPGLYVSPGSTVAGTFRHIPLCSAAAQTGCAYSWASYAAGDDAPRRFGVNKGGLTVACASPAFGGTLDAVFASRVIPNASLAPFTALDGQVVAACRTDEQGAVLRITIPPGANAAALQAALDRDRLPGVLDWGLHVHDVALAEGSILRAIAAETQRWMHP